MRTGTVANIEPVTDGIKECCVLVGDDIELHDDMVEHSAAVWIIVVTMTEVIIN